METAQMPLAEAMPDRPDILVVLGKNIDRDQDASRQYIQNNKYHLSPESRMNVLAARILYQPGMKIIFSTGKTAGEDIPSEAEAMKDYFLSRFRLDEVNPEDMLTEERSIDTASNAEEISAMLPSIPHAHVDLLTVGYHSKNARTLFRNFGVPIRKGFVAEEILSKKTTGYREYVDAWDKTDRIKKEWLFTELPRFILLHTFDPKGEWVRKKTKNRSKA